MGYSGKDDDSGHDQRSGVSAPVLKNADDVRRSIKDGAMSGIAFKADDEGNAKIFGFKVDKSMMAPLELGLNQLKLLIVDNGAKVYKTALIAADKVGIKGKAAGKTAAAVDTAIRWGVIGAQQISSFSDANSSYAEKRRNLYDSFKPIMEATRIDGNNNEVIGLAFKRARSEYGGDLKWMLTDIPTILPMAFYGLEKQNAAKELYKTDNNKFIEKSPSSSANGNSDRAERERIASERRKLHMDADAYVDKIREEHVAHGTEGLTGAAKDAKAKKLIEEFNRGDARDIRAHYIEGNETEYSGGQKSQEEKSNKSIYWLSQGGIFGSQILKANLGKNRDKIEQDRLPHVPELINHLREEITNQLGGTRSKDSYGYSDESSKSADDIQITGMGRDSSTKNLKAYILDMFQQHERDREPATNWVKHDANGHVEIVNPLGPALVDKLQPSIDLIADAIASGLDPAAMVNLIGDNKIIVHGKNGAKTFSNEEVVRGEIDRLMAVMSSHEVIKLEEYLAKFEKPEEIKATIKGNLMNMKGAEKALFASLFPDDILKQFGMKQKDIIAMRKETHAGIYDFMAANVLHLAKADQDQLKKLGLADTEIQAIQTLAEKIESGDEKSLKVAVDGHDKAVLDAARTAGLLEQHHGTEGKKYWDNRVAEMADARGKLSEAAKGPEHGDDDREPSSYAEKVSKKRNGRYSDSYAKDDNSGMDDDSMDAGHEKNYAKAYEKTRGRYKPNDSERPVGFSDSERARRSGDDERVIS